MSKTFTKAGPEVSEMAVAIIRKHHPRLAEVEVRLDFIFVATDAEGAALLLHGYPCAAVVRIISAKDRAAGRGDAEVVIDEDRWLSMDTSQQRALLDHEIEHLVVATDANKRPKIDGGGRPVLKMKKHDYQFGWFASIAERHGEASGEVGQARVLFTEARQSLFFFVEGHTDDAVANLKTLKDRLSGVKPALGTSQLANA